MNKIRYSAGINTTFISQKLVFIGLFIFIFGLSFAVPVIHIFGLVTFLYFFYLNNFKISLKLDKRIFGFFLSGIILIAYSYITVMFNYSIDTSFVYTMFLRYFLYLLVVYIWAYIFVYFYVLDEQEFLNFILSILIAQSICVYLSVFSPGFYALTTKLLPAMGNIKDIGDLMQSRYRGFSNSGGDGLSLILSLGPIISLRLFMRSSGINKYKYFIIFWLTFISIVFVGRTGLVVVILYTTVATFFYPKKMLWFIAINLSILPPVVIYLLSIGSDALGPKFNIIIDYAFEFLSGQSKSSNDLLQNMLFIPKTLKTFLFGDGIYQNSDSTNYMQTDSGYVRSIFFYGVVGCVLFYGSNLYFLQKLISKIKSDKSFFYLLIVVYLVVEVKRPFMLGFAFTNLIYFMLFYSYLLEIKNENIISN